MSQTIERKPIIGVPCARLMQANNIIGHVANERYVNAIIAAGGAPLLIPTTGDKAALRSVYELVDAILFTGGSDIDPQEYGEEISGADAIDALRDRSELVIAKWAVADNLPILGICRGHQLLNVAMGGTLYQDLPTDLPESNLDHTESSRLGVRNHIAHPVMLAENSRLAHLVGSTNIPVNTLHHQAVKQPAPGLKVVGTAPDGVVEALEASSPDSWMFSLQCHPEELWREHAWAEKLFKSFVVEASSRKGSLVNAA